MRRRVVGRIGKGIALFGLVFALSVPAVRAQGERDMETKGLSPAAMSIFRQQVTPAALRKKANRGDDNAALMLGYMYRLGHKVKKNPDKAVQWFRKSADRGNAEGQLQMAIMYAAGEGVKQDYGAMRQWLQKSAENGYALSQFQLGLLYARGITVEQDVAVARMWLGFAAGQPGEVGEMAKTVLENLQREAAAVATADFIARPLWIRTAEKYGRALAVLQSGVGRGDAHSRYLLGVVFNWLGSGDDADRMNVFYREAAQLFEKAAVQDYPPAQYMLGAQYFGGKGVTKDSDEALLWTEKAAKLGYAPAQVALGEWYGGNHSQRDPARARAWFERAAAKRNGYAKSRLAEQELMDAVPGRRDIPIKEWDARDQYMMALAYEKGEGVPVDPEQAAAWYRMAASQLLVPGQRRLGLAYLKGKGVAADEAEAALWLGLAAEQGDAQAKAAMASLYASGKGVPKDEGRAFLLWLQAADEGIIEAKEGLGILYRDGRGVKKDMAEALKWFEKAAAHSGTATEQMLATMQENAK